MKNITIHIIGGTGKMGQWLKVFFESENIKVTAIGRNYMSYTNLISKADIVIISVPISQTEKVIKNSFPFMTKKSLLTDITSVKVMPLSAMEKSKTGTLGMHPLFGPFVTNLNGQKIIFCRQKNNKLTEFLKKTFEKRGIAVLEMSAKGHDYQMAYIQALTHAVHLLYVRTLLEQKIKISDSLQTPTFILHTLAMERILSQDIELTSDIQIYNPYFKEVLKEFIKNSGKLLSIINAKDKKGFVDFFSKQVNQIQNTLHISEIKTNKIIDLVSEMSVNFTQDIKPLQIRNMRISYLGPEYSYSHIAANAIFPKKLHKHISCDTLYDVFDFVANGKSDIAVVPAENSREGTIANTLDFILEFSVQIIGSFVIPIRHQLISSEKKPSDITLVFSHPQALAQCRQYLKKYLPHAKTIPVSSTTSELSNRKKGFAFIASKEAADAYKIPILAEDIQDENFNSTKFYLISKKTISLNGINTGKTLLFLSVYNRVGVLRDILNVFAQKNIDLTKLESRPSYQKLWDYHFFIEVDIDKNDTNLLRSLKELQKYCPTVKILGQT